MQFSARILVRKLSPGQAREFGFYAVKQGKTNLLVELFRVYRSSNGLSEQEIAERVGINPKSLSSYRAQLSNLVLEFLAYQKFKASTGSHSYFKYKVLMELGYEEKAKKELENAVRNGGKGLKVEELFPVLMNLDPEKQQDIQEMDTFQDFIQLMQLRELKSKLAIGIKEVFMPQPHISAMESIAAEYPILNHPEQITSPRVKAEYHDVKRRIFIYQRDWDRAETHILACLKVIERNPRLKEEMAITGIEMVERLAILDTAKQNYESAISRIMSVHNFGKANPNLDWRKQLAFFSVHLTTAIDTGEMRLRKGFILDFFTFLSKNQSRVPVNKYFVRLYYLTLLSTMNGDRQTATLIMKRYGIQPGRKAERPRNLYINILEWVLLFEKGEMLRLEEVQMKSSRIISTYQKTSDFFKVAHDLFKELMVTPISEQNKLFRETRQKFLHLQDYPDESSHFHSLNLIDWLDSRIIGVSWISIVKSRFETRNLSIKERKAGEF